MKLLGRVTSINVRKVLWTGAEIGLAFDHEPWGEAPWSLADPAFLALNPSGLIPVLVDGDFVLRESNTICRYLAGLHGRLDLLPAPGRERATVEQWMDWMATELNTSWRYAFLAIVRRSPGFADPTQVQASLAGWARQLALRGSQHASFTDAEALLPQMNLPSTVQTKAIGTIDPAVAVRTQRAYIAAFFDLWLRGRALGVAGQPGAVPADRARGPARAAGSRRRPGHAGLAHAGLP